jgi:hypothetical protein
MRAGKKTRIQSRKRWELIACGLACLTLNACDQPPSAQTKEVSETSAPRLFAEEIPQSPEFQKDLEFLQRTKRLKIDDRTKIESDIADLEAKLGVPHQLMWCLLFQESRFDPLKNSEADHGARGLGQFTPTALEEINRDTNHFDLRVGPLIQTVLDPDGLPLSFLLEETPKLNSVPRTSYYRSSTAVYATGVYLNNRYQQIKKALDKKKIAYDPQILWLFAAAAYNKGARTILVLLTQQLSYGGDAGLGELLTHPKLSYSLLTREDLLEYSLRELWNPKIREKYVAELAQNMEQVINCAVPERVL